MKPKARIILLLVCINGMFGYSQSQAEKVPFSSDYFSILKWSTENGLPQNNVQDIEQGPDGSIWVATYDGLVRFDGRRFDLYHNGNTPQLVSSFVTSVKKHKDGSIWVSTTDAIIKIVDRKVFGFDAPDNSHCRFRRVNGDLYIWSAYKVFRVANDNFIEIFKVPDEGSQINDLFWQDGFIVQTVTAKYLLEGEKSSMIAGPAEMRYLNQNLYQLSKGDGHCDYFVREGLHFEYLDTVLLSNQTLDVLGSNYIREIYVDSEDYSIYRCKKDLVINDEENQYALSLPAEILDPEITSFLKDQQGLIWLGSSTKGLVLLMPKLFRSISSDKYPGLNPGNMVYQSPDSLIWFDNGCNGLLKMDPNTLEAEFVYELGCPWTFLETSSGIQLVGGYAEGVQIIDSDSLRILSFNRDEEMVINALFEDSKSHVWLGTGLGIYEYTKDKLMFVDNSEMIGRAYQFHEDLEGNVIVCGSNGIGLVDENRFFTHYPLIGLPTTDIRTIYQDADNIYWMGSSQHGLFCYMNNRVFQFPSDNGLIDRNVWTILEDTLGNFWMSSNNGIYRLNRNELIAYAKGESDIISSTIYDRNDGMFVSEGNSRTQNKGFTDFNGNIWFSTIGGPVYVNPYEAGLTEAIYPLRIDAVYIDEIEIDMTQKIVVEPDAFQIQFEFSQPNFYHQGQTRYEYQIENLDERWFEVEDSRLLTFSELPAGDFSIRIRQAGTINEVTMPFEVQIPFVETNAYKVLLITLIMLIIFALIGIYIRKRILRLRHERDLRDELTRLELRSTQAQLNPHFIFNCLSSIKGLYVLGQEETANSYINQFSTLLRTIIEHSGQEEHSLEEEIHFLKHYMSLENLQFDEPFEFDVIVEKGMKPANYLIPTFILQTFVENAIKHGLKGLIGRKGKITISLSLSNEKVIVEISDNGVGMEESSKRRTAVRQFKTRGTDIVSRRINLMNKLNSLNIEVETVKLEEQTNDPGTRIIVKFPVKLIE